MSRIVAMLPTYNEAENIGPLIDAILALGPELEALVVDDNSPDGTWRLVAARAAAEPRVHLLHRTRDKGRGLAGIAGFREALRLGADAVIEMDADWSHDPQYIPALLEQWRGGADVVIGSRLVAGGGETGRHPLRPLITHGANLYIRLMLRLTPRDATSGYRVFSRRCLAALPWEAMHATGPEVVQEVLLAAQSRGFKIVESPILFVERRFGQSTFNRKIMLHSLRSMARLRWQPGALVPPCRDRLTPLPGLLTVPLSWGYGLARGLHRTVRAAGARRLPVPVLSIGNLSVGGTGKTPLVALVARQLLAWGRRPAVVSRGYRAAGGPPLQPLVVGDGQTLRATAAQAGDEPRLLAERLPGTIVIAHADRHRAALLAIESLGADAIVLDDGFQHDGLARDVDLVLWDLRDDPARARRLPAGRLREGLGALRRAHAVILTHGAELSEPLRAERMARTIAAIKRRAPAVAVFEAVTHLAGWRRPGDPAIQTEGPPPWQGQPVVLVSGLARPEGFEATARAAGADVVRHLAHGDHHVYTVEDCAAWRAALTQSGAALLLTTAKDAVKISSLPTGDLPVWVVEIEAAITDPGRWEAWLRCEFDRAVLNAGARSTQKVNDHD